MKKWIPIVLAAWLLAPLGLSYTFIVYRKAHRRQEVKAFLRSEEGKENLVSLSFHKQEFEKIVGGDKEFEYEGMWYDVVYVQHKGDSVMCRCLPDELETHLEQRMSQWLGKSTQGTQQTLKKKFNLAEWFDWLYCSHGMETLHTKFFARNRWCSRDLLRYFSLAQAPFFIPPESMPC